METWPKIELLLENADLVKIHPDHLEGIRFS